MAIWTANIKPKDLSRGFKSGKGARRRLRPARAAKCPSARWTSRRPSRRALASFEMKASRRRVLVYLGDGKSVAQPVDGDDPRRPVRRRWSRSRSPSTPCPSGRRLDAAEPARPRHRHRRQDRPRRHRPDLEDFVARLKKDVAEPILYPEDFRLSAGVKDVLPTRMPPLRRDAATLVVGKLDKGTAKIGYTLTGTVFGNEVKDADELKVPATDDENFFLTSVHGQWKAARDRPALLQADRALAFAYKQNQLAVEDLVAKAEMALEHNKLDASQAAVRAGQHARPALRRRPAAG